MRMQFYPVFISFVILLMPTTSRAQLANGYAVAFELDQKVIPVGSALQIRFTLANNTKGALPLQMDIAGLPNALVRIYDKAGNPVRHRSPSYELAPRLTPEDEVYRTAPGERLMFSYDLGERFEFQNAEAGPYTVQFVTAEGVVARAAFEAVTFRYVDTTIVQGAYEPPQLGELMGNAKASLRLSTIESIGLEKPVRWLMIDQVTSLGKERTRLPSYSFQVENNTSVEKVEMDRFGQVWIVVRSGESRSLVLWRLHDLYWETLVPWTTEKISLGTTRGRMFISNQNAVFAGVEGKPKFTTHSVWGKANAAIPATQPNR